MNIKQHLTLLLPFVGAFALTALTLHYNIAQNIIPEDTLALHNAAPEANVTTTAFSTEKAQQRNIISMLKTTGVLLAHEIIKIGNIVNGVIIGLYAKDSALIEEGQLLAEIDDGREDGDVNASFGNLDATQAVLTYQLEFLKRQQQLFICKQISLDTLQQAQRDYEAAYAKVEQAKGLYEQSKLTYDNKRIHSPTAGMVIERNVSVGEAVSNFSPANVLYSIAKNPERLKASIIIDTSTIRLLKIGTQVTMSIDTNPKQIITGPIQEISQLSHETELTNYTYARLIPRIEKPAYHSAIIPVDNSTLTLRPGMTFSARIVLAEKENVLSVPTQALSVTPHAIQQTAAQLGYRYQPLDNKKLLSLAFDDNTKTIWIYSDKAFIEKAITVGINDANFYEVTAGLDGSEDIVYATYDPHAK